MLVLPTLLDIWQECPPTCTYVAHQMTSLQVPQHPIVHVEEKLGKSGTTTWALSMN